MFSILLHSSKIILEFHFEPSIKKTLDKIFQTPSFSYQLQLSIPNSDLDMLEVEDRSWEVTILVFGKKILNFISPTSSQTFLAQAV